MLLAITPHAANALGPFPSAPCTVDAVHIDTAPEKAVFMDQTQSEYVGAVELVFTCPPKHSHAFILAQLDRHLPSLVERAMNHEALKSCRGFGGSGWAETNSGYPFHYRKMFACIPDTSRTLPDTEVH